MVEAAAPTADTNRPGAGRLIAAVALSAALSPLNSTMIAVALGDMQTAFSIDSSKLRQYLVTSYLLTGIVLQSAGGKAGDRIGHHRTLALGQMLFAAAALAAFALPSLSIVTLARITMAAAGAIIIPSAMALLRSELPFELRGRAFGAFGATMGLSAAIGPRLGALLLTHFSWRAMFLANVPVLIISALLAQGAHRRPAPAAQGPRARFDWLGSILLGGSLALLALGSERAGSRWFLLAGLLGLPLFALWERRAPDPVVEFGLFKLPTFAFGSLIIAFQNLAMYSLLFELPQVAGRLFGVEPKAAGRVLFAMMGAMVVASAISGRLSDKLGARWLAVAGCTSALLGVLLLRAAPLLSLEQPFIPLVFVGLGLGMTAAPAQAASLSAVPKAKAGMAAGLTSTMRYIGGMAGLAILGIVLSDNHSYETVQREHATALTTFAVALAVALGCSFGLPRGLPRRADTTTRV